MEEGKWVRFSQSDKEKEVLDSQGSDLNPNEENQMVRKDLDPPMHLPLVKVNEVVTPEQIRMKPKADSINWSHQLLNIPRIWRETEGKGTRVAVLDTGCDINHPDLKSAIKGTRDFTGEGIDDVNGHGTHCAGVVGARRNNQGFVGIAPKCDLLIAKVLSNRGGGSYKWISDAVDWCVEEDVNIISMSLGGPISTPSLFRAIHNALARGITIVCAAGNEGSTFSNTIAYPGRYGGVLTIGSHDSNGNRSGFSSRGGEIDFLAPGDQIYSTYPGSSFASLSGTSMATPFVAGICALIYSEEGRGISNCEDMRNVLMKMSAHPGCHDNVSGYGPLNPFQYFDD